MPVWKSNLDDMASDPGKRDAGEFSAWLSAFSASLSGGEAVDVPCEGCTACCRSGKLIPVEPDEVEALEHIPASDLMPRPGDGSRSGLRHDESGCCAQLSAQGCSVYARRPRACRMYDCRIFAAAGL